MLVDISVKNTQILDPNSLLYPSKVRIIVDLFYFEQDYGVTSPDLTQTLTYEYGNSDTQDFTFDIDQSINNSIFLAYKIEAFEEIAEYDFDEPDLFETVEESFGKVYLYPVGLGPKALVQTYAEGDTYINYSTPPAGSFSGITAIGNSLGESPPDPVVPIEYTINGLVSSNYLGDVPSEYDVPQNMPNYSLSFEPLLVWAPDPVEDYIIIANDRWELVSQLTKAIRAPIVYAENTNEFRTKVSNDYTNIRLKGNLLPSVGSKYAEDGESLVINGKENALRLKVTNTAISTETTDYFEIDLEVRRPSTDQTAADPTNLLVSDIGALMAYYMMFKIEVEVEVQNPTTGEWSIYAPRIRIPDIDYMLIAHTKQVA